MMFSKCFNNLVHHLVFDRVNHQLDGHVIFYCIYYASFEILHLTGIKIIVRSWSILAVATTFSMIISALTIHRDILS